MKAINQTSKFLIVLMAAIFCLSGVFPAFAYFQNVEEASGGTAPATERKVLTAEENGTLLNEETGLLETPMTCEEAPAPQNGMRRSATKTTVTGTLVESHDIRCIESPVSGLTSLGHGDGSISYQTVKAMKKDGKYKVVYCLEYMKPSANGVDYTQGSPAEYNDETRKIIGDIIANGWQYTGDKFGKGTPFETERHKFCATQMMIWAALGGNIYYNADGVITFKKCVIDDIEPIALKCGNYGGYYSYFVELRNKLIALRKIPSFAYRHSDQAIENYHTLSATNDGTFSHTLSDKNKVLGRFDFTFSNPAITSFRNGNYLRLTSTEELTAPVTSLEAKYEIEGGDGAFILWKAGNSYQPIVECQDNTVDPVWAFIAVQTGEGDPDNPGHDEETPMGRVFLQKIDSETGKVPQGDATLAGAVFGFYDKHDTLLDTYTTDSRGEFITKYYPCDTGYYFKEISPPRGYLLNDQKWYVDITPAKTKTVKLEEPLPLNTVEIMEKTKDGYFPLKLTLRDEKQKPRADIMVYFQLDGKNFLAITDENGECGFLMSTPVTTLEGCTCLDIGQVVDGNVTPFDEKREKQLDRFLDGNEFASNYKNIDSVKYSYPQS